MTTRHIDLRSGGPPRQPEVVYCTRCISKRPVIVATRLGPLCLGCLAWLRMEGKKL